MGELRLPTIGKLWQQFTERADREGWPSATPAGNPCRTRTRRTSAATHSATPAEARLPPGKTLDSFDFATVPMVNHAHVTALASGDAWLEEGRQHPAVWAERVRQVASRRGARSCAVENGYRVLFTRTTDLVQRLQTARQILSLESAIEKLDKYHLIILDDLCYVATRSG